MTVYSKETIANASEFYVALLHRFVEDQGAEATHLLVDSVEDYDILEAAIEETKPEFPPGVSASPEFYLLTAPFRYQKQKGQSTRFRPIGDENHVLYAAENADTALIEFVAYRRRFYLESEFGFPTSAVMAFGFSFVAKHSKSLDLRKRPFVNNPKIVDRNDYSTCHEIVLTARECDIGIILYESARDPAKGGNAALLTWQAIHEDKKPTTGRVLRLFFKEDRITVMHGVGKTYDILVADL